MKAAAQLADQGKTDEAVAAYEKIGVLKNPKSESWRLNSEGVAYLNAPQAQPEKSVSLFEKAVEADPDNILAYNNLGLAYEGTKQWDKAKDAFQKAVDASQAAHLSPARYQANLKLLQISMDEMADKKADEKTTAAANASVSVTPSTTVK
jgi:tetratricopeptide (TPR) repeat protein